MPHIPALDGLRAVAIAMVVAFHYGLLDCGWLGVQLFFVLSGFLITRILQAAREQPLGHYLGRFWRRRALRIFPLYFGYLLLLSAVFVATGAPVAFADSALYLFTYTFNLTRPWLQQGSPAFTHFWSLCVEEQFYLLWPLAVFFLAPRRLPQLAIAMIALAPVARLVLGDVWLRTLRVPFHVGDAIYWSPLGQMDALATGAVVAILRLPERVRHPHRIFAATFALALGLGLASGVLHRAAGIELPITSLGYPLASLNLMQHVWSYSAWNLCFASALVWVLQRDPRAGLLCHPAVVATGRVSYGIYVFHNPLLLLLRTAIPFSATTTTGVALLAPYCAVLLLLSHASYRGYESWFLRRKDLRA
jgi:peptidoglycan/LPS O-acetylase OafA/YrhL